MNQDQITKLKAHTDHLVNSYIGLLRKYSFLKPMIFDSSVAKKYGDNEKRLGFETIRITLLYSSIQDVVNLCFDSHKTTPSIIRIIGILAKPDVHKALRAEHTTWSMDHQNNVSNQIKLALEKLEEAEKQKRGVEFDQHYKRVLEKWDVLQKDKAVIAFKEIRNKLTAHLELKKVDGEYKSMDVEALGIKWDDLGRILEELEEVVIALNLLIRNAGLYMEGVYETLDSAQKAFWAY